MAEAKKEEKPRLTEAEIQKLAEMDYTEKSRWYGDSEELCLTQGLVQNATKEQCGK